MSTSIFGGLLSKLKKANTNATPSSEPSGTDKTDDARGSQEDDSLPDSQDSVVSTQIPTAAGVQPDAAAVPASMATATSTAEATPPASASRPSRRGDKEEALDIFRAEEMSSKETSGDAQWKAGIVSSVASYAQRRAPAGGWQVRDKAFDKVLRLTGKEARELCFRCKLVGCPGVRECMFESNVFIATRSMKCNYCNVYVKGGESLVTKMKRGEHEGFFIHQACAHRWYTDNPVSVVPKEKPLEFATPPPELAAYLRSFAAGEQSVYHLDATAGAGKSSGIIFVVSLLRAANVSFVVLVFNKNARQELMSRGLRSHEVSTFHSYGLKPYREWVKATLEEDAVMLEEDDALGRPRLDVSVVYSKIRMLVGFYFRHDDDGPAMTKLYRPFVDALAHQARTHGFGTPNEPSNFDEDAPARLSRPTLEANEIMGLHDLGTEATWLTGDQIVGLAHAANPDGFDTSPRWLSGPGPINYWRTHFARTLADESEYGRIHIMVVNSAEAKSIRPTDGRIHMPGRHWFVVAWRIDPPEEPTQAL